MIRIQLVHEGRVVKTISSRVHESVVLEQINRYKDQFDEIYILEGELSEGAKDILHHVAKKIVPAAMAAGVALAGANGAHAQNVGVPGQNRDFPGLNQSIGQHIADIVSPNYYERQRQRVYQQQTAQQEWNAEQNEIRQARIQQARERGRAESGLPPTGSQNVRVYDQARTSNDGKYFIIYGMDNSITRIPTAGTDFMKGDSQRLPHYIAPNGQVYYVRHPAGTMEGFKPIGTIPASGTGKNIPTRTGSPAVDDEQEAPGTGSNTPNTPNATATIAQQTPQAGNQQTGNTTNLNIDQNGQISLGDEEEPAGIREDAELNAILDQYSDAFKSFKEGGDIDDNPDFFQALFDYYSNNGEMPYGVQKAREGDPYEWIADRLDRVSGVAPVAESDEEATAQDQASADQNIIVQLMKAVDNEVPQPLKLSDGTITISASTAKKILDKFNTLKPDSKALMQQTLNTVEGFRELLNYFNEREIHEEVDDISNEMQPYMEARDRAQRLIKSVFGNI